jgi:hypothetical protein
MSDTELKAAFTELRTLLAKHAKGRAVVHDTADHFYVNEVTPDAKGKAIFFGAVKIGTGKVAFHLMPIYAHPELLAKISPELKKRMQGKSCFNFKTVDPALFRELEGVVKASAATKP